MKKKILIINNNMKIGGVQKSLVNLLSAVHNDYDVTLFLMYKNGELLLDVPSNVKIKEGNRLTNILGMSQAEAKKNGIFPFFWRSKCTILTRIFGTKFMFPIISRLQKINDKYDCVISFLQNGGEHIFYGGCNEFALNAVKCDCKISFVHCDFKNYEGNNEYNKSVYKRFDKIVGVSNSVCRRFSEVVPELKDKCFTVHNCYDFKKLEIQGNEYKAEKTEGKVNIFSASRISEEKGIIRMIPIFKKIRDCGYDFVWRIAGDGIEYDEAQKLIDKFSLNENIILLGEKSNPYPYFKSADLLLVPSYAEAAPMVFGEAEFFGLPIITTDTTSATELVEEHGAGIVCKNTDEELENTLIELLKYPKKIKCNESKMTNEKAIEEFKALIG